MKEYLISQYPHIDYIYDDIMDDNDIGYTEEFKYGGVVYHAEVIHDGTYMEYGIKGSEVIIKETNK